MKKLPSKMLNLIQLINSPTDELIKLSQIGSNPRWIEQKIDAMQRHSSLELIDANSKLWKKLIDLRLGPSIKTASVPQMQNEKPGTQQKEWSGIMTICENTFSICLDDDLHSAGVVFTDIISSFNEEHITSQINHDIPIRTINNRLDALVNATANHGAFLFVPEGLKIEKPFKILVIKKEQVNYLPLRFFSILQNNANAKIMIEFRSENNKTEPCFIPAFYEGWLGADSCLEFVEFQAFGDLIYFFPNELINVGENATLNRFVMDKGSRVTRRFFEADMNEAGGKAQITGVYSPAANKQFVYDTRQNHFASNTISSLLFKGVLDEAAEVLWKGNIFVKEGIFGADGFQLNNNLLLNSDAHAESIPGLEINANDVKCSHGVTMSDVDEEQLFYLQSRGIETEAGKKLIVDGFIHAAINKIENEEIQSYIEKCLETTELVS